jgi:hypothetical protein
MMHDKKGKVGASKMGKVKTAKPSMGSASKRADGIAVKCCKRQDQRDDDGWWW